jgi:hypothetical protein
MGALLLILWASNGVLSSTTTSDPFDDFEDLEDLDMERGPASQPFPSLWEYFKDKPMELGFLEPTFTTTTTSAPVERNFVATDYSEAQLALMRPRLASLAIGKREWDLKHGPLFAPLLKFGDYEEFVNNLGEQRSFVLGDLVVRTKYSTLFFIKKFSRAIVKYQTDCFTESVVHPLLRDAWFLSELADSGMVPQIHYVSPPAGLPDRVTLKTRFLMSDSDWSRCLLAQRAPTVRFMVMERIDEDFYALLRRIQPSVLEAITITHKLLRGIKYMHSKGIVHGDIHPGNLGLIHGDDGSLRILFFDFGSAFFVEEKEGFPDLEAEPRSLVHCLYSHWNIEGFRFGYRDDVFKALMVLAFLIHGRVWTDYCVGLVSDVEAMLAFKRDEFFFELPPHIAGGKLAQRIGTHVPPGAKRSARTHLARALALARKPDSPNSLPDYDGIIAELYAASVPLRLSGAA